MAALCCLGATTALSQTQLDLGRQGKNVDFSAAATTKPHKSGTSLPGTCSAGETFFKSDATAGQNTYACTAPDTWTLQGDGGGGGGGGKPPREIVMSGGVNQGGFAASGWSLGASDAPTPVALAAPLSAALSFAQGSDKCAETALRIPDDWDGGTVTAQAVWRTSVTTGSVVWTMQQECVADDEVFSAWTASSPLTDAALATANRENHAGFSALTMTGCDAGETMYVRFCRDDDHENDDLDAAAELLLLMWKFGRT
jgi:hypothetical protein